MSKRPLRAGYALGIIVLFTVLICSPLRAGGLGGDFTLTDHHGERFSLAELRGKPVLMVFGFSHCPDVCPLELATVAQTMRSETQRDLAAVFITLDPQRDSVERLAEFVPFFHERIIGLTGSVEEVHAVAKQYGVKHSRYGQGDDYTIDHSTGVHVLDADGKLQSIAPFGANAMHLRNVVSQIDQQ